MNRALVSTMVLASRNTMDIHVIAVGVHLRVRFVQMVRNALFFEISWRLLNIFFIEIGVNLRASSIIKYDFEGSFRSTIAENIRVGFTTTNPKGFLLGFSSNITGEYLTIMVSNSGKTIFELASTLLVNRSW